MTTKRFLMGAILSLLMFNVQAQLLPPANPRSAPERTEDKKAVTVVLTQHKVVKDAAGKEVLKDADTVKPGDVIEYRAVYKNVSARGVRKVAANVPLPEGLEYLPGSAHPKKGVEFSSGDGVYGAEPLTRRAPGGRVQNLPYNEYRQVRWSVDELAPAAEIVVSVRAKVEGGASMNALAPSAAPPRQ